ncbi:hypothetical protein B0H67DRAFT_610877 [Lasiosphaeris hirsuta]|uniref:Uncharacterized protein n=1 Tax=Lasiosphaeris hirsuta TaxID=260670 RepID=A0AA40DU30_9PEZI|nr:hypothetical protein B0H67DRAFT_610877 [Lasiosphaeris hirsuta]
MATEHTSSGPTLAPTQPAQAPPGYKFIKVRKPDGAIVTVKKKLSPKELEDQQQLKTQSQAGAPKTDAAATEAKKDGVEYKLITVRMPDGTLAKVKRPASKTGAGSTEKPTSHAAPAAAASTGFDHPLAVTASRREPDAVLITTTTAPENPLTAEEKKALREQDLHNKQQRRVRFQAALLFGLVGAADTVLPDLVDGDEIMPESDLSDDEDFAHGEQDDDHQGEEEKSGAAPSDLAPVVAVAAATAAAGVAANSMGAQPAQPPQPPRQLPTSETKGSDAQTKARAENGTGGYKVTVKDLKNLDEMAEKQQDSQWPLERRWAAFSFYLLASLSVVLPALFLVLACFIMAMNGKSSESTWGRMVDPIKIAVTVWPIVFAAVTAQGFKTWAAYKVERGVKLMELEQLVGSNSFGAVVKQPFLLRRLDLLTLGIFAIWALSPIGSQALLRSYTLERGRIDDRLPVKYAPALGYNMLLSPGAQKKIDNGTILSNLWQATSSYYVQAFLEDGVKRSDDQNSQRQDPYNHPLPLKLLPDPLGPVQTISSLYGLPIALIPPTALSSRDPEQSKQEQKASADAQIPFEDVQFPVTSSYFDFTCNNWKETTRGEIDLGNATAFSWSQTLGMEMFSSSGNASDKSVNRLRFSTLLDANTALNRTGLELDPVIVVSDDWKYAVIECGFQQVFFSSKVLCHIDANSGSLYTFDCAMDYLEILPDDQVRPEWHTHLGDFSNAFVRGGSPYPMLYPSTPTERYSLLSRERVDGITRFGDSELDALSVSPSIFADSFGTLFNTFVHIAHCPECIITSDLGRIDAGLMPIEYGYDPDQASKGFYTGGISGMALGLYRRPGTNDGNATHAKSTPDLLFKLDWRWVGLFLACVIVLFLVGVASVILESVLVAPDVLGYASTLARNSRYLHLPKTAAKPMGGPERARAIGGVKVMIQDVKPDKDVGKIALGLKHDRAEKLKPGRLYR